MTSQGSLLRTTLMAFLATYSALVSAFEMSPPIWSPVPVMIAADVVNQQTLNASLRPLLQGERKRIDPAAQEKRVKSGVPVSTVVSGQSGEYIEKLSRTYPPPLRAEARRAFEALLVGYKRIEDQFGIPRNDMAGAVAAFIAGSYMAYNNADFPDAKFRPLVTQMRQIIGESAEFAAASVAEKQETYDQLATLGMFMATTQMALKQTPNVDVQARLRTASAEYLKNFLNVDASRVRITADGLSIDQ